MSVRYKHGRELVRDRTAKSRLGCVKVTESQLADDAAVYATSRDAFESATVKLVDAGQWALRTTGTIWHRTDRLGRLYARMGSCPL